MRFLEKMPIGLGRFVLLCLLVGSLTLVFGCSDDSEQSEARPELTTAKESVAVAGANDSPDDEEGGGGQGEEGVTLPKVNPIYIRIRSVDLSPARVVTGADISLEPIVDPRLSSLAEGEVIFNYRWYINEVLYPFAEGGTLPADAFERDDTVTVTITPVYGDVEGKVFQSAPIVVQNAEPVFLNDTSAGEIEGSNYVYSPEVQDPEGDDIIFSLENQPEGMVVDSESGIVTWEIPGDYSGGLMFDLIATDVLGAEARQRIKLVLGSNGGGEG